MRPANPRVSPTGTLSLARRPAALSTFVQAVFRSAAFLPIAFLSGAFLFAGLGCATMRSGPPTVALRISSNVPDATVWIDDRLIAPVAELAKTEKRLVVGFHRIEVRAPGYYSHFAEVDVKPNQPLTLQAPLHPLLD